MSSGTGALFVKDGDVLYIKKAGLYWADNILRLWPSGRLVAISISLDSAVKVHGPVRVQHDYPGNNK